MSSYQMFSLIFTKNAWQVVFIIVFRKLPDITDMSDMLTVLLMQNV